MCKDENYINKIIFLAILHGGLFDENYDLVRSILVTGEGNLPFTKMSVGELILRIMTSDDVFLRDKESPFWFLFTMVRFWYIQIHN